MKIAMINGSPKPEDKRSATKVIMEEFIALFDRREGEDEFVFVRYHFDKSQVPEEFLEEIDTFDALILNFPLYYYAFPSQFLSCLMQIEKEHANSQKPPVYAYAIMNCEEYQGYSMENTFDLFRNWAVKAGFLYGGCVGVGGGTIVKLLRFVKPCRRPKEYYSTILEVLRERVRRREDMTDMPTFLTIPEKRYYQILHFLRTHQLKSVKLDGAGLGYRP